MLVNKSIVWKQLETIFFAVIVFYFIFYRFFPYTHTHYSFIFVKQKKRWYFLLLCIVSTRACTFWKKKKNIFEIRFPNVSNSKIFQLKLFSSILFVLLCYVIRSRFTPTFMSIFIGMKSWRHFNTFQMQ